MKQRFSRLSALLLALLMLFLPLSGCAADSPSPIEALALELLEAQAAFTQASEALTETDQRVEALEEKYNAEQLTASRMTLATDRLRLHFKKF